MELERHLEEAGLNPAEAQVYLALLDRGPLSTRSLASIVELPRTSLYPILRSLSEKGLVDAGLGYGSKYSPAPPSKALPGLLQREHEALAKRERAVNDLVDRLAQIEAGLTRAEADPVEVIRDRRRVSDLYSRLQIDARKDVLVFVKAPILGDGRNLTERKSLEAGVVHRAVYEVAILEDRRIAAHLRDWRSDKEQARVYDGVLPHKLAIFDSKTVLFSLQARDEAAGASTLVVRNSQIAQSLRVVFDYFWQLSVGIREVA